MSRRETLLDAAITVLGERGIHALTHRNVESAAGLPAGSTSNLFSTRSALLNAVVERFAHRERENWDALARANPANAHGIARALADFARESVGRHRALTLARYAILVEAGTDPALRAQLLATGAGVNAWFGDWLRAAGSADPERDAPIVMNHWTGVVLHELAVPDAGFDPYTQIVVLIEGLVAGHAIR